MMIKVSAAYYRCQFNLFFLRVFGDFLHRGVINLLEAVVECKKSFVA